VAKIDIPVAIYPRGRNSTSILRWTGRRDACHRVVGSDGTLTGYGGGLWRKQRLLDLEAELAPSG